MVLQEVVERAILLVVVERETIAEQPRIFLRFLCLACLSVLC